MFNRAFALTSLHQKVLLNRADWHCSRGQVLRLILPLGRAQLSDKLSLQSHGLRLETSQRNDPRWQRDDNKLFERMNSALDTFERENNIQFSSDLRVRIKNAQNPVTAAAQPAF